MKFPLTDLHYLRSFPLCGEVLTPVVQSRSVSLMLAEQSSLRVFSLGVLADVLLLLSKFLPLVTLTISYLMSVRFITL
jgi:hypothetical protein